MDIEEIREKIRAEIVKTEFVIVDYEELTKPISPDDSIGRLTRMDAIQNKSVAEAALRQSRDKLNKLRYALSHLDDPEFGKCAKWKHGNFQLKTRVSHVTHGMCQAS
jgi:DnaK suppressor protein